MGWTTRCTGDLSRISVCVGVVVLSLGTANVAFAAPADRSEPNATGADRSRKMSKISQFLRHRVGGKLTSVSQQFRTSLKNAPRATVARLNNRLVKPITRIGKKQVKRALWGLWEKTWTKGLAGTILLNKLGPTFAPEALPALAERPQETLPWLLLGLGIPEGLILAKRLYDGSKRRLKGVAAAGVVLGLVWLAMPESWTGSTGAISRVSDWSMDLAGHIWGAAKPFVSKPLEIAAEVAVEGAKRGTDAFFNQIGLTDDVTFADQKASRAAAAQTPVTTPPVSNVTTVAPPSFLSRISTNGQLVLAGLATGFAGNCIQRTWGATVKPVVEKVTVALHKHRTTAPSTAIEQDVDSH